MPVAVGLLCPPHTPQRKSDAGGLAEGVGFEPTIRFPVYTLSKRAPSATRPSLHCGVCFEGSCGALQGWPECAFGVAGYRLSIARFSGGGSTPSTLRPPYQCDFSRSCAISCSTEGPLANCSNCRA